MLSSVERLELALGHTSDVYVAPGVDSESYFRTLAADIRKNRCQPFPVQAVVEQPGFDEFPIGATITGVCVARRGGYWLVHREGHDEFYCFWGTDLSRLSAPGILGSPLHCWSA